MVVRFRVEPRRSHCDPTRKWGVLLETLEDLETRSQVGGGGGAVRERKIAEKTSGVRGMLAKPSQQDSCSEWPG